MNRGWKRVGDWYLKCLNWTVPVGMVIGGGNMLYEENVPSRKLTFGENMAETFGFGVMGGLIGGMWGLLFPVGAPLAVWYFGFSKPFVPSSESLWNRQ